MAGVLLHWAMGDPEKLDPENSEYSPSCKKAYALGLLLPDIAKQGLIGGEAEFNRFFEGCSASDIPTWGEYLRFCETHHFNPDPRDPSRQDTRNPDLAAFLRAGYTDLKKPVWQGAFCHLMGDKAFYYRSYCVDEARAMEDFRREVGAFEAWDAEKWRNSETGRLWYDDYNVLNTRVEAAYGVLERACRLLPASLLRELLAAFRVEFSSGRAEPKYMNLESIKRYIALSRQLCRRIKAGEAEEVLRLFDGDHPDAFFQAPQ